MVTIEKLKEYGADADSGLARCFGNEDLYLKLVGMMPTEKHFEELSAALEENNLDKAFEAAHALKGTAGNLSLMPLYGPLVEITELLRTRTDTDYSDLMDVISEKRQELQKLYEES